MTDPLTFIDANSVRDLKSFLVRAARIELGAVHLVASGSVLAATIAVLYPTGLLERRMPTVLGMRTFRLAQPATVNTVVKQRAVLDRIARINERLEENSAEDFPVIEVPTEEVAVTWGGITPPRAGWSQLATLDTQLLSSIGHSGISEIAEVIPGELGEARVRKVRGEVWGRSLDDQLGLAADTGLPAGVAFAGLSLGFFDRSMTAKLYAAEQWLRLSTPYGHVLTRKLH